MNTFNNSDKIQLDNAGKIYPAAMTKNHNSVFRISAYMKSDVKVSVLKQAVIDLAPRFPTMYVQLLKGFCWYYLVKANNYDIVEKETTAPCRPMAVGKGDKPMFRVLYKNNRISVEFFHGVTDGTGAVTYLKTLLGRYLELQGFEIEKAFGVLDVDDLPEDSEMEDSFLPLYKKGFGISRKESNAYQFTSEVEENFLQVTSGTLPIKEIKNISKNEYNCTITEYLVSVYAFSFLQQYLKHKTSDNRPIKISVPINLRPYFNSDTLRNFASFVNVEINPVTDNTVKKIIKVVKTQMDEMITKDRLHRMVSQNVSEEKMFISKYSPNFLKKPVMKICYKLYGERKYTSVVSNIGLIKLSPSMAQHVEKFDVIIGGGNLNLINCSVIGFENNLTISLSAITPNTEVQDFFFETLKKDGISVNLSNTEEKIKVVA